MWTENLHCDYIFCCSPFGSYKHLLRAFDFSLDTAFDSCRYFDAETLEFANENNNDFGNNMNGVTNPIEKKFTSYPVRVSFFFPQRQQYIKLYLHTLFRSLESCHSFILICALEQINCKSFGNMKLEVGSTSSVFSCFTNCTTRFSVVWHLACDILPDFCVSIEWWYKVQD